MKTMYSILAIAAILSMTSCSSESTDAMVETTTTTASSNSYVLEETFGARSVSSDSNAAFESLPAISLSEATELLSQVRQHKNAVEDLTVTAADNGSKRLFRVEMIQTINKRFSFSIMLNLTSYADGSLFYSGYEANCNSTEMSWYLKGFSLSNDSKTGLYKFSCQSYIYLKVVNDGVKYMQVPVSVNGTYNPENHEASFTYSL